MSGGSQLPPRQKTLSPFTVMQKRSPSGRGEQSMAIVRRPVVKRRWSVGRLAEVSPSRGDGGPSAGQLEGETEASRTVTAYSGCSPMPFGHQSCGLGTGTLRGISESPGGRGHSCRCTMLSPSGGSTVRSSTHARSVEPERFSSTATPSRRTSPFSMTVSRRHWSMTAPLRPSRCTERQMPMLGNGSVQSHPKV